MGTPIELDVVLSRQEDGLWRADVLDLAGCWCDAPTLEEALAGIQSAVKLVIDSDGHHGLPLPEQVTDATQIRLRLALPVSAT